MKRVLSGESRQAFNDVVVLHVRRYLEESPPSRRWSASKRKGKSTSSSPCSRTRRSSATSSAASCSGPRTTRRRRHSHGQRRIWDSDSDSDIDADDDVDVDDSDDENDLGNGHEEGDVADGDQVQDNGLGPRGTPRFQGQPPAPRGARRGSRWRKRGGSRRKGDYRFRWIRPIVRGTPPAGRLAHSAAVVRVAEGEEGGGSRKQAFMVVFGGVGTGALFNDVHVLK